MKPTQQFRLSVEELAFALAALGWPATSKGLMISHFGEMESHILNARLLAGGHGLLARRWLSIDVTTGATRPEPGFFAVLETVAQADYTVHYSRVGREGETRLSYHVVGGRVVAQRVVDGIIYELDEYTDLGAITEGGLAFFGLDNGAGSDESAVELAADLFQRITNPTQGDSFKAVRALTEVGYPEAKARTFVEDVQQCDFRGSAMRVEYPADNRPVSDHGFLVLRGSTRIWFGRMITDTQPPRVRICPGNSNTFRREIALLLANKRNSGTKRVQA